ncbi:MAG TPA: hypothetical protein VFV66_33490 [Nonomuraea sp.]|nr:hypothetical protein [Nonomuraea sp.]
MPTSARIGVRTSVPARLPAVLLLLLSWLLPATAHARLAEPPAAHAPAVWRTQLQPAPGRPPATWRAQGQLRADPAAAAWRGHHDRRHGFGQEPYRHAWAQARHVLLGLAGPAGAAVLPCGPPYATGAWAAVAAPSDRDAPASRRPAAAAARAPPSTGLPFLSEPRSAATAA